MTFLFLILVFIIEILQLSVFPPIFGNAYIVPSLAFLLVLFSSYKIKEKALLLAFLSGLFYDAVVNFLGFISLLNVVFTYLYLVLNNILFVKNPKVEVFLIMPLILLLRKLTIFLVVNTKFPLNIGLKDFGVVLLIDLIFLILLYKVFNKYVYEKA
ncbi:hypothetical protein [Aquifex aeolicus]|uniref:Uncharacterized protein aq_1188 n=1 Tax=Aquifex aeolicus (strain VF5) TaxID=224324 RepID=Y1188_AQUAE|nr:hypothetical protein [Aquifex aeolicus]O67248.1 RecName: Full=Uncharacterized protein aq_1188 [Aquifex aeolicus VF5]AAC07220.1 putative protein [Aquifex aeolicus VF5]